MITKHLKKQHQLYENFEHTPIPVIVSLGENLVVEFVNTELLAVINKTAADVIGVPISNIFRDTYSDDIKKTIFECCVVNEQAYLLSEKQIISLNEDRINVNWYDIRNVPFYRNGKVTGVISYFFDVSDSIVSKRSIDEREQYIGNFFKQAPVGIVCYRGPEFIVDFANDKALEMWGKTIREVKGKPVYEIFPEVLTDPKIRERHKESLEKLKRGETHIVSEVELTFHRKGKPHTGWFSYIHEPYTNRIGEVIGMMAIAIEVTEEVRARKKLQLITDALPALVSYINTEEQYEFVNAAYERWFGVSRENILGRSIRDVLGDDAYGKVKPYVERVLQGKTESLNGWIPYKDAGRKYISATYIPHFDDNKRVLGYFGLVADLTDLKNSELAFNANEQRLRLLTEGVGAGIFEYDLRTGAIYWSAELKLLMGIPADMTIDRQVAFSVLHPDDANVILEVPETLKRSPEKVVVSDYRIIRKDDGLNRWVHSRFKIVTEDQNGVHQPVRIIGFTIDITDRKEVEERLKKFNEKLEMEVDQRTQELTELNLLLRDHNDNLKRTQSFLQQLIDSSVEIIAVVNRELKYLAVNNTFEKKLGLRSSDVIGKTVTEVFPAAKDSSQLENIKNALNGKVIRSSTYEAVVAPGVYVDTHFIPLRGNDDIQGVIMMVRDVTDVVKKEKEFENLNNLLKDAQSLAKLGSWEWDINTGTVLWSDEMYRIYGYTDKFPVDFVKATERMSPEHAERSSRRTQQYIQEALDQFKKDGSLLFEIPPIEFPITLPHGETKLLRSAGKIQLHENGKLYRVLGIIQDVTQIRSTEEKLRQVIGQLQSKNKELESFNYVASHDLKEPLRKIQLFIDRIQHQNGVDIKNYLNKINDASTRMTNLIESILALSQVSNSRIEFADVDLNTVLHNVKSDLEVRIKETNATISNSTLPVIIANEAQMNQVFSNLIVNSLKFSNNTPVVEISCDLADANEIAENSQGHVKYWRLKFSDNGIGFDNENKDQIFEPFQRLHNKSEFSGTGIGLSIVKRIVERHNGVISVDSVKGTGTTFTIYLPVGLKH